MGATSPLSHRRDAEFAEIYKIPLRSRRTLRLSQAFIWLLPSNWNAPRFGSCAAIRWLPA